MGKLIEAARKDQVRATGYVVAAERACDAKRYGRARRLFRLAGYSRSDIVTFYDSDLAELIFADPEE